MDKLPRFPIAWLGQRRLTPAALALAASLAMPQAAPAQEQPPSPAALVEEVEVIARLPGPALWRVSTPTSQLWIIGLPGALPKGFTWDDRRVATALDGARELVLPPAATGGLGDLFSILVDPGHVLHLPPGKTVRSDLPPALVDRFEAAARSVGQNPSHYDHWRPVLAALLLMSDANRHYRLSGPTMRVAALAKSRKVKPRPLANYKAMDLVRGLAATPTQAAQACMALAADAVERMPADTPRRAAAWAIGDLKALKTIDDAASGEACLDAAPAVVALRDRAAADWAKELGRALTSPGKTVAAIDLGNLTRKGGLLDQLKAQGLDVIGPTY
ncbi:MAG: TraB/GumN family protein [Caulobacteraceae bacterium]